MEFSEEQRYDESETDAEYSDDSQDDPTFDALEETRLTFSKLTLKRKIKTNIVNGKSGKEEEGPDAIEMVVPELDEQDQKSYEAIQKIIEGGQVEKLKVEQCKIYLRKHGLRLSGKKETLIQRIKEHIDVVNGGGEKKYPASSFVLNCKGDACMGDIVMFEQNVYEEFNIASRSARGPPSGTRVVAGRIVKESYGAAKQQHTFTIEVLWSKGEKPLPPLHPLLIKGRNLYRLKTMRQKWDDEGERQRILSEKHARGGVARSNREARIQQKEIRKMHKATRETRNLNPKGKEEEKKREPPHSVSMKQGKQISQLNIPIKPGNLNRQPNYIPQHTLPERVHQRQPLISMNCSFQGVQLTSSQFSHFDSLKSPTRGSFHQGQYMNYGTARSPVRGHFQSYFSNSNLVKSPLRSPGFKENRGCSPIMRSPLRGFGDNNVRGESNVNINGPRYNSQQSHASHRPNYNGARNPTVEGQGYVQKQTCRYYVQGRCFYGDRCKYLHESAGNKS